MCFNSVARFIEEERRGEERQPIQIQIEIQSSRWREQNGDHKMATILS